MKQLNSGIQILREGEAVILLNIPPRLTPEQAQELAAALNGELDPDYAYHCGAVAEPLPYHEFKTKNERLNRLLNRPLPEGVSEGDPSAKQIKKLCGELGY